jgi:hypothetical protein
MSDFNSTHNRAVWFDISVTDLDRAATFYNAVLGVLVTKETHDGFTFCVIDHKEGNGGCLVPTKEKISSTGGVLIYLNVDNRLRDAVQQVDKHGGKVLENIFAMGPYDCRAIVLDSEGNRIALHSTVDA